MEKKTKETKKKEGYVKPEMKTVVTPKEVRDIDQPCAWKKR